MDVVGAVVVLLSSVSWALGTILSRRLPLPRSSILFSVMNLLAGGALLLAVSFLSGETAPSSEVSWLSIAAVSYLIVFGSWVGFTAYLWLLRVARTSLVSTYAYVNPVVAVFLGWLILDETITIRTLVAGAVIVASVALIISAGGAAKDAEIERELPAQEAGDGIEGQDALERVGDTKQQSLAQDGGGELDPDG